VLATSEQDIHSQTHRYLDSAFAKKGAVTDSFLPLGTDEAGRPKFFVSFMGNKSGASVWLSFGGALLCAGCVLRLLVDCLLTAC